MRVAGSALKQGRIVVVYSLQGRNLDFRSVTEVVFKPGSRVGELQVFRVGVLIPLKD